ncbi:MAG: class II fructose-bisphosphate aldolase [Bdellovibrionia bacterium]
MQAPDLRKVLTDADTQGIAIAHFNVSDLVFLKAVFSSAQELNVPILVGVSDGERKFIGVRQISALVQSLRDEFSFPIFLNADHTHSLSGVIDAANAGFDLIVFDASALSLEENIKRTREAVEAAKSINPAILIEGELGNIGTGSSIHDNVPESSKNLTDATDAKRFVEATGIDLLSPAVGTMHGMLQSMLKGQQKKHLNISRIEEIKRATRIPLTLHGGSGTDDEDFRKAISAGITVVHINTELRVAWRRGLEQGLTDQPQEIVPYKVLQPALDSVKQVARARMELFSGTGNSVSRAVA